MISYLVINIYFYEFKSNLLYYNIIFRFIAILKRFLFFVKINYEIIINGLLVTNLLIFRFLLLIYGLNN